MTTGSVLAQFTITLSQAVSEQVAVEWHTADGTALAGVDYAAAKGTVLFAPGETAKTVDILVYGRAFGSEDRSFFVEMLPPVNAILGASIGECIIHVDATGSTPVTQIIVPTGPQGPEGKSAYQTWLDLGNTGSEQDFIDSLSPSPEEIAEDVAPLIDVGDTVLTAEGTEGLSKPDATTVKAVARRVAYVGAAKIATVVLADGDNLIGQSDLTGDTVDVSSVGLYPRIMRGTSVLSPQWSVAADGRLLIKDAVAGDVLYVCQYDIASSQAVTRLSFEALRRSYAEAGYDLIGRFSNTGLVVDIITDVVLWEPTDVAYLYSGTLPHTIGAGETPVGNPLWGEVASESLRKDISGIDGASLIGGASYATLRSYTGSADRIHVFGRVNIFDLASGIFVRSNTDTTSVDDDGIVLIDALGRRWHRQYLGEVHPEWFGAKGDGVADDTLAIQKMFDSKNNSPTLANNFFGSFRITGKHRVTANINAGRPIKVDAFGAEFIVEGNFNAITFSMHNGEWAGGYFNYMNVPNATITELAVAIQLAPETNPIQVMNSVIRGVRVWGAHTGVKFQNPNTAIWMVELANIELAVRAGSSTQKACGVNLDAGGGAGGSTTVNLRKVSVGGKGSTVGAGLKGYRINGVNEVSFYDCSYDGYELSPGVDRIVNSKDILDITAFRCNIEGFHTEQLVNNAAPFTPSPIYINTNSFYMNGLEMLLTKVIGGPAWVYLDGDGVATIGTWHDIPAVGQAAGRILDISGADDAMKIISTGALKAADIIGGKSRIAVSLATEPSPYGTNTDITTTPGNAIMTLPTDCEACEITVVGEDTTDSTLGWFSHLLLVRAGNGVWTLNERTVKMANFTAATMGYNVSGNNLVWTNNSSLNYRIQCRVESKRAAIAAF